MVTAVRLLAKLKCPHCDCTGGLLINELIPPAIECSGCGSAWSIESGIPVFLDPKVMELDRIIEDVEINATNHLNWRRMQVRHMEEENADPTLRQFEISRPFEQGLIYEWMHSTEIKKAWSMLDQPINGAEVLVLCAGRGMDSELAARLGGEVTCTDISLSSLKLCQERFARASLPFSGICCDAESLPFAAKSFDICAVYDGLHHLPNPYFAVAEMVRIARRAVVIVEPNASPLVALAQNLGLSTKIESSGNHKHYFDSTVLSRFLAEHGMHRVRTDYRTIKKWHYPNKMMRVLSTRAVTATIAVASGVLDRVMGRFGNRLISVAEF